MTLRIAADDPRAPDVLALIQRHLAFNRGVTPDGHVHALEAERLAEPEVTFFSARRGCELLGIGAIKRIDATHAEIKSMHTAQSARRQGVGAAMVAHLLAAAAHSGYQRVSLETGSTQDYAPARALYAKFGFTPCGPFDGYTDTTFSAYMTKELDARL